MISDNQIKKAVSALVQVISKNKTAELWEEGQKMFCQVNLHRIPQLPNEKDARITVNGTFISKILTRKSRLSWSTLCGAIRQIFAFLRQTLAKRKTTTTLLNTTLKC